MKFLNSSLLKVLVLTFIKTCLSVSVAAAQNSPIGVSADTPLAERCGPQSSSIVCVNKYASVMPYHFFRQASANGTYSPTTDDFRYTMVSKDTSFALVKDANFVVFDKDRGLKNVLGQNPIYEFMYDISDGAFNSC